MENSLWVRAIDRHRNGSRLGITAVRHSSTPWLAPCRAVRLFRIMASIPIINSSPMEITSGESMQFPPPAYIPLTKRRWMP